MTFRQERLLRLSLQIIAGQEPRRDLLVSQGVTASNVVRTPSHRSTQAVGNQDEVQLSLFSFDDGEPRQGFALLNIG
jgi:hypothetical protein